MSDELVKRLRQCTATKRDQSIKIMDEAADRIEAMEAAINAALERLDASLFTNAEHQQAKDILREATR